MAKLVHSFFALYNVPTSTWMPLNFLRCVNYFTMSTSKTSKEQNKSASTWMIIWQGKWRL